MEGLKKVQHSKGNFSLVFLIGIFFLIIFVQIATIHVKKDYEQTVKYAQGIQLRHLAQSLINWLYTQPLITQNVQYNYKLYPGSKSATVEGDKEISVDGCFEKATACAYVNNDRHAINYMCFYPTQSHIELGAKHMFISRYVPTGAEFLSDSNLYTSRGSFILPQISFLKDKAHTALNMEQLHEYGFEQNMTYIANNLILTYLTTAKTTKGQALLAVNGSITIKKSFTAPDRLILISKGSVVIEDYVNLGNILIMTNNNVNIGKNCKLNGVIFSGGKISISGKGTFTHDASAVASFASAFYIA